jgi:hypothetical protein
MRYFNRIAVARCALLNISASRASFPGRTRAILACPSKESTRIRTTLLPQLAQFHKCVSSAVFQTLPKLCLALFSTFFHRLPNSAWPFSLSCLALFAFSLLSLFALFALAAKRIFSSLPTLVLLRGPGFWGFPGISGNSSPWGEKFASRCRTTS